MATSRPIWVDIPKTRGECVKMLCTQAEQITTLNGEKKQSTRDHSVTDRLIKHLVTEATSATIHTEATIVQAAFNRLRKEYNHTDIWSVSDIIKHIGGGDVEDLEEQYLKTLAGSVDGSS